MFLQLFFSLESPKNGAFRPLFLSLLIVISIGASRVFAEPKTPANDDSAVWKRHEFSRPPLSISLPAKWKQTDLEHPDLIAAFQAEGQTLNLIHQAGDPFFERNSSEQLDELKRQYRSVGIMNPRVKALAKAENASIPMVYTRICFQAAHGNQCNLVGIGELPSSVIYITLSASEEDLLSLDPPFQSVLERIRSEQGSTETGQMPHRPWLLPVLVVLIPAILLFGLRRLGRPAKEPHEEG